MRPILSICCVVLLLVSSCKKKDPAYQCNCFYAGKTEYIDLGRLASEAEADEKCDGERKRIIALDTNLIGNIEGLPQFPGHEPFPKVECSATVKYKSKR